MKNKKLENSLVDEIISQAFTDAAEEDFEEIEPITLDAAWPEKNIKIERRAYDRLRRKGHTASAALKAVACLAIVIVVAAAFVFSVPTVRAGFLQLIDRIFDGYTNIEIDGKKFDEHIILNEYVFDYIPEGFKLDKDISSNNEKLVFISETEGRSFSIKCYSSENFLIQYDNEQSIIEEVSINGVRAFYCHNDNEEKNILSWSDGGSFFVISGNISKQEMLRIAENIKKLTK